jgi:GTP cyclohydrolase I
MNSHPSELPAALIPDVQAGPDERRIAIDRVGVRGLRYPRLILDRHGETQQTIALCTLDVALSEHVKGTHMSRFVGLLEEWREPLSLAGLPEFLRDMVRRLEAQKGHAQFVFPYFRRKSAPVSGVTSLLDYEVTFSGWLDHDAAHTQLKLVVPVTSLCPSSKGISEYGAHNQRSHLTLTLVPRTTLWIADMAELAEAQGSSELFGLLKRSDEKFVTERAYDNPKFVEDMVRDVAQTLNADERVAGYVVEAENFESIHNHSAYARICRGMDPAS